MPSKAIDELDEILRCRDTAMRDFLYRNWKTRYVRQLRGEMSLSHVAVVEAKGPQDAFDYEKKDLARSFGEKIMDAAGQEVERDTFNDITTYRYTVTVLVDRK